MPPIPPGPSPVIPDAAIVTEDADASDAPPVLSDCEIACANLHKVGCPEATKHGQIVCTDTCEKIQRTRFIDLDVACLVRAETVLAVKLCGVRCQM